MIGGGKTANFNFTMEGIDELEKDLTEAIGEYPVTMRAGLKDIAKDFRKSVRARTPTIKATPLQNCGESSALKC